MLKPVLPGILQHIFMSMGGKGAHKFSKEHVLQKIIHIFYGGYLRNDSDGHFVGKQESINGVEVGARAEVDENIVRIEFLDMPEEFELLGVFDAVRGQ